MLRSTDDDTDFFDINDGVLQGGILVQNMFMICPIYVPRKSIELIKNGFALKRQEKSEIRRAI